MTKLKAAYYFGGRIGDDAKAYLEKQVKQALEEIKLKEREE